MKQGEIWNANLNPPQGSEQAGFRPVVIVSGNLLNAHPPFVIAMPLTTKIKNYKGNPVIAPTKTNGLKAPSEILVFHVRSISKDRLTKRLGTVDARDLSVAMKTVNDILKY